MLSNILIFLIIFQNQAQTQVIPIAAIIGWLISILFGLSSFAFSISSIKRAKKKMDLEYEEKNASKEYVNIKIQVLKDDKDKSIKNIHGRIKGLEDRNDKEHDRIKEDISKEISTRISDIKGHIDTRFKDIKDLINTINKNEKN